MKLGALAYFRNPHTSPIAAELVVSLAHEGKDNKENRAADNRCITYGQYLIG